MNAALIELGCITLFVLFIAGSAWIGQMILFLDRKGPFQYGWKGITAWLAWLAFVGWLWIRLLEWIA